MMLKKPPLNEKEMIRADDIGVEKYVQVGTKPFSRENMTRRDATRHEVAGIYLCSLMMFHLIDLCST